MHEEEYELIPLSPIRKLEKRLDRVEKGGTSNEMMKELVDVVKTNQAIVEDIVKVNSEMMAKVSELSNAVSQMTARLNDFMSKIEVVGESEPAKQDDEMERKLDKIEKRLNAIALSNIARMKMPKPVQQVQRRPVPAQPGF
ncbi:MAG: hypothetical protein HYW27_01110 [Candidatus Aenigmarchaeota archaeon]|nr:hypothetical protein [Candidatus Aenigmarchaeota archaeon]